MSNYLNDSLLIQTFNSLPGKLQEEAWDFMQFLLFKYEQESKKKPEKKTGKNIKSKRQFGYFPKGSFEMSDDFDASLECFKEYMK